jgi:hypothetical protein
MADAPISDIFQPQDWHEVPGFSFGDITYHRANSVGAVRIAFNRPEVRNAFRPKTVDELYTALDHARQSSDVHHQRTAATRSAAEAISESEARTATDTRTAKPRQLSILVVVGVCIFSNASGLSALCQRS